jgi:hypothetical protein
MIFLDSTIACTVELAANVSTSQLKCYASWRDAEVGQLTPGFTSVDTNNTTAVNLVPSPASPLKRGIDFITIHNDDTASATVTIKVGTRILYRVTLAVDENLQWTNAGGFVVISAAGTVKTSVNQIAGAANSGYSIVVLASDVVNNNATANTIQDVTGLSFSMTNGKLYNFEFYCYYTAALASTGSRWAVNASAGTAANLCMTSEYSLATTTTTRNANVLSFDSPAASNATSGSTGNNLATMKGVIRADADGVLIARFASEVASSAITCKAGSFVTYRQID